MVRCTAKSASADNKLKKIALTGIDDLPAAASGRLDLRPGRSLYVIGARTDPPVGKFNVDPRADRDCRRGPQRAPIAVAHQRKTSRQHAAVREGSEQLRIPVVSRPPCIEEVIDRAVSAFAQDADSLLAARDVDAVRCEIGGSAGAQTQRDIVLAIAAALDVGAQKMCAEPAADLREGHAMNMCVSPQRSGENVRRMIEPLPRRSQESFRIWQRPRR